MKAKEIIIWLIIFIVGSLIVSFLVEPNSIQSFKNNIKSIFPFSEYNSDSSLNTNLNTSSSNSQKDIVEEETLIDKCKKSFNECKEITTTKYSMATIPLIKIEQFDNKEEAEEFFYTWGGMGQTYDLSFQSFQEKEGYPLVLIATKHIFETPIVIICNKEGKLLRYSKITLLCGR